MASWALITYTRESTDKDWFEGSSSQAAIDKVTEFQNTDPKKIIHYETADSADGLKRYFKLGFKDVDTAIELKDSAENIASVSEREAFCNNLENKITVNEITSDEEPSIPA
jgi:hypothetical protein